MNTTMLTKNKIWYRYLIVVGIILIFILCLQTPFKILKFPYQCDYKQAHFILQTIEGENYSPPQKKELQTEAQTEAQTEVLPFDTKLFNVNFQIGRWDNRRIYKYFDNVVVGDKYAEISTKYNICLATQSSLERLDSLIEVSDSWSASISLSMFIAGNEYSLLEFYVSYLRKCFPQIRDHVTFHLAFSPDHPPSEDHINYPIDEDCDNPKSVLQELLQYRTLETNVWRNTSIYPQNHVRNLARKNCQTFYVFLTDIDIIPRTGIAESVDLFLKTNPCKTRCAYVVPVYEIDDSADFPNNKADVIQLVKKQLARPFHQKVYQTAQSPTNYKKWESDLEDEESAVHVSHTVIYKNWYEPFFIVDDTAPPYDERFMGYGYSRNTQVYEMNAAGYQFYVLSPVFACHWHLQTFKEDYYPWRKKQLYRNLKLVSDFKKEIAARYKQPMKTKGPPSALEEKQPLKQEKQQLKQEKQQPKQENQQPKQEKQQPKQENQQPKQEKQQLEQEKQRLIQEKQELEPKKEQLEPEKEQLDPEKEQLELEKEQLEPEKEQLEPENEQLEPENEQLEPENEQLEQEIELEQDKELLEPEKELLEPEKEQPEPGIQQLEQENDQLEPEIEQFNPEPRRKVQFNNYILHHYKKT